MADAAEILIADDDEELCELLATYLSAEGLVVRCVHRGDEVAAALAAQPADLLILDIMLPGLGGLDVLRELRGSSALPVLMLTARGDDVDRIVGLELGADDYLPKPCNPRELLARIRAVLRRSPVASDTPVACAVSQLELEPAARKARLGASELKLTSVEFDLLQALVAGAGEPVSRDALSQQALGRELLAYDRSVDVHISNLRRKLAEASAEPPRIVAVRHRGYQLVDA